MPHPHRSYALLPLSLALLLSACGGRSDWPSLSCWGEVPPATADVEMDGTDPSPAAPLVGTPMADADLRMWQERIMAQWQVFEAAVRLIEQAPDKEMAMSRWLGAQLELTSIADIISEFDDALGRQGDKAAADVRGGWAAAYENASQRMEKLKPQ